MSPVAMQARLSAASNIRLVVRSASCSVIIASSASGTIERISADSHLAPVAEAGAPTVAQHPAVDAGSPSRVKWTLAVLAIVVAVAIATAVWMTRASTPATTTTLANAQSIPLVSVMSPGVTAVTSNVTFTGAISARYDMPIGVDGDARNLTENPLRRQFGPGRMPQ